MAWVIRRRPAELRVYDRPKRDPSVNEQRGLTLVRKKGDEAGTGWAEKTLGSISKVPAQTLAVSCRID